MSFEDLMREKSERHRQTHVVQGGCLEYMPSIRAAMHDTHIEINLGKSPRRKTASSQVVSDILIKGFLTHVLKERFKRFNPDVGTDVVDWLSAVPRRSTFGEGLEAMRKQYPHYAWEGRRK